jgi:hypothetical protein
MICPYMNELGNITTESEKVKSFTAKCSAKVEMSYLANTEMS